MVGGGGSSAAAPSGGSSSAADEEELLKQLTLAAAESSEYPDALVGGVSIVELSLPKQEEGDETVADPTQTASYQKELAEINSTYEHLGPHDERFKAAIRLLNNKYGVLIKDKVKGSTTYKATAPKVVEPKAEVDPMEATSVECGCTEHPIYGFRPNPKLKDPFDLKAFNSKNISNTLELIKGFCRHQLAYLVERGFIRDPKDLDSEKIFTDCCLVQLSANPFVLPPLPPPQADKWGRVPKAAPKPGPETFRGRILAAIAAAVAAAAPAPAALEHDSSVSPLDCAACKSVPRAAGGGAGGAGGAEQALMHSPDPLWSVSVANLPPEICQLATEALDSRMEALVAKAAAAEEMDKFSLPEDFEIDAASANRFMASLKQPQLLLLLGTGVAPPDSSWNMLRDQCASHGLKEEFRLWREARAIKGKKAKHPSLNMGGSRKGAKNVGFE